MLDVVFQPELNTVFCSVVECSKICDSTFLLQEGTSQKVVHSLWFRTTFTGHVFGHPVSPFHEICFAATSAVLSRLRHLHSVQLESAPGGSSSLALMDMVIDGGRLASLSFHNVSLMLIASMGLTALRNWCASCYITMGPLTSNDGIIYYFPRCKYKFSLNLAHRYSTECLFYIVSHQTVVS